VIPHPRARASIVGVVALLAVLTLPACAPDPDDSVAHAATGEATTTEAGPDITVPAELDDLTGRDTVTVTIRDNAFDPRNIRVSAGTEIEWVNEGNNQHNVTPAVDGSFSGIEGEELEAGTGNRPAITFAEAGEYAYYCSFHGTATVGQTGFILVE
jgi:plastocyanin